MSRLLIALCVLALLGCTEDDSGTTPTSDTTSRQDTREDMSAQDTSELDTSAQDTSEPETDVAPEDTASDTAMDAATDSVEPPGPTPFEAGSFDVLVRADEQASTTEATIDYTLCAPSIDGGASLGPGAYPLVVLSPGLDISRGQYRGSCEHIASWGFVVVLQDLNASAFGGADHPQLGVETRALIDWVLSTSDFASSVDGDLIATAGHSLGGKTSALVGTQDDRVDVVVGWDPVDADPPSNPLGPPSAGISVAPELMGSYTRPLLVFGETLDASGSLQACAPEDQNYTEYYEATGGSAVELTMVDADHIDWVEDASTCGLACSFCQSGAADTAEVLRITRGVTVAFLLQHLYGRSEMADFVTGSGIQPEIDAGRVTLRSK